MLGGLEQQENPRGFWGEIPAELLTDWWAIRPRKGYVIHWAHNNRAGNA